MTPVTYNGFDPLEIGESVARRWMAREDWSRQYTTDLCNEGLLYLYDATGNRKYLDHVLKAWESAGSEAKDVNRNRPYFTCLHFDTWLRTGDTSFLQNFVMAANDVRTTTPRAEDGAVCYNYQPETKRIFIDMIQGYCTFMARAGWFSDDASFYDECSTQYRLFRDVLRNPETGLWHQGRNWEATPNTLSPGHWNRGQGWVFRGLVECLYYLPDNSEAYRIIRDLMREFAADYVQYQDARGMWHQLVAHPEAYPETSGTAFFLHYCLRAIQRGWLPAEPYQQVVDRGLDALLGYVHRDGTVLNTSHGSGPLPSLEAYLHRPSAPGDFHGSGAVMMACAATAPAGSHRRLQNGPPK
jgi:rhamnogalacturonyl hydrolase YesR